MRLSTPPSPQAAPLLKAHLKSFAFRDGDVTETSLTLRPFTSMIWNMSEVPVLALVLQTIDSCNRTFAIWQRQQVEEQRAKLFELQCELEDLPEFWTIFHLPASTISNLLCSTSSFITQAFFSHPIGLVGARIREATARDPAISTTQALRDATSGFLNPVLLDSVLGLGSTGNTGATDNIRFLKLVSRL